jgi:hypothetical protein
MKTKFILSVALSFIISIFSGVAIATSTGWSPAAVTGGLFLASFIPSGNQGGLMMGILKEVWTGELVKAFRHEGSFLGRIASRNDLVNNNTIHMVDVGADPSVLINNTTYPIAVVTREDGDLAISLDKYDTENTRVTRDELYALSYDKMANVIEQHKEVLQEKEYDKSLHALAPSINTTNTPIILTTGGTNGAVNPRKRLKTADIISAKKKLDDLKVPKKNRILILCNDHIEDLLLIDEAFEKQYKDVREGQVLKLYGFDIYEYGTAPVYKVVSNVLTKKAFGAAVDEANDQNASVFLYTPRAFQATGTTEMFYKDASTNPEFRESVVGFRQYHICLPKKWIGFGAIVSAVHTG